MRSRGFPSQNDHNKAKEACAVKTLEAGMFCLQIAQGSLRSRHQGGYAVHELLP